MLFVAFFIAFLIPPETTFLLDSSKNIIQSINNQSHHKNCAILANVIIFYKKINYHNYIFSLKKNKFFIKLIKFLVDKQNLFIKLLIEEKLSS